MTGPIPLKQPLRLQFTLRLWLLEGVPRMEYFRPENSDASLLPVEWADHIVHGIIFPYPTIVGRVGYIVALPLN